MNFAFIVDYLIPKSSEIRYVLCMRTARTSHQCDFARTTYNSFKCPIFVEMESIVLPDEVEEPSSLFGRGGAVFNEYPCPS